MSEIPTPSVASISAPFVRDSGGGGQLSSDLRLALLFFNEGRYRALERLFGCPKDQANLLTLVAGLVMIEAVRDRWQRMMSGPMPSGGDAILGIGSVRELMLSVVGPSLRDKPYLGALITTAFVGRATVPIAIRSIRSIRTNSQRFNSGFRHRYGYLVDVGHRRQRGYEARARKRAAPGEFEASRQPT